MWYNAARRVEQPAFGISFYDEQGRRLNGPNTVWAGFDLPAVQGRGYVDYIVDALPLLNGRYDITVAVYDRYVIHPYDHWHRMCTLSVVPGKWERQDGMVYVPCRWRHVVEIPTSARSAGPACDAQTGETGQSQGKVVAS